MAAPVEDSELSRRRRDKAAELMGQYLLRGYRMLASHCPKCTVSHSAEPSCSPLSPSILAPPQTVLLQSRDGEDLCVYCNDVLIEGDPRSHVKCV